MCKPNFGSFDSTPRGVRLGTVLAVIGAVEGIVASLVFVWLQNARLTPAEQFLMAVTNQDNGSRFTVVLILGFLLSGIASLFAITATRPRMHLAILILVLGLILTGLSTLAGFSIGGFTIFGALLISVGGLLLVRTPRLKPH